MSRLSRFAVTDLQILMAGHVLESGMRFGALVIYSRVLGQGDVGLVAAVSALIYLVTEMTNLGTDAAVISLGSKEFGQQERERLQELCHSGLWLHLALGTAVAVLGSLAAPILARELFPDFPVSLVVRTLWIVFLGSVVYRIAEYVLSVLRTYQRFRFHAAAGIGGAATLLGGVLALSSTSRLDGTDVLVLLFLATPLVVLAIGLAGVPGECLRVRAPHFGRIRDVLAFGKWIWATTLIESAVRRGNVLLLQIFAGSQVTAQFHVASRYAEFLSLVFEPLRKYLLPKFTELSDREAIASLLRRTYRPLSWTLLLIPLAWVAAGPVITGVQGEDWRTAVQVFRFAVVARLLFLLAKPMTFVLFSLKKPWIQAFVHLVGAVVFFACARVLIPSYGAVGSAIALLVFSGTVLVSLALSLRREWTRPATAA